MRWTGQKQLPGGGFGRFALKAKTNLVGSSIALSSVDIQLDGNAAEGVLTFANDGRQTVQGTLAAEDIDLTPYVSAVRLLAGDEREWNAMPITLDRLAGFDLDLRLSAAQVKLPGTKLGRTAIAANLRGGQLTVTVGESQSFGGVVKGSFDLAKSQPGADVKAQLQFTNVDLQSCLGALLGMQRLEGKGNLAFNIEGSGSSVMAVTQTLTGSATLIGQKGAVTGVNVEQLLRRLERRPLSGGGDYRSGRTPYDKLTVALSVAQGNISADEVRMEGPAVRLVLAGKASVPARDLDFTGAASLVSAASEGARLRAAFHGARRLGRSADAARHPEPDPPGAGGGPAPRCGPQPRHARHGALGHRPAGRQSGRPRRGQARRKLTPRLSGRRRQSIIIPHWTNHSPAEPAAMRRDAGIPLDVDQGPGCFAGGGDDSQPFRHHRRRDDPPFRHDARAPGGVGATGLAWAWPNVMLGAIVIVPLWLLVYLFRPPGRSSE